MARDSVCAARVLFAAVCFALVAGERNPKRGFVGDGCPTVGGDCPDPVILNAASFYYTYNPTSNYPVTPGAASFVPMHWCTSNLNSTIPASVDTSIMMGFNEPNNAHNCNIPATTAAAAWATVMKRWPHSRLISPATAGNGIPWLTDFFSACDKLYGKGGCNISAVAVHDYSCTPSSTMSYLETIHNTFHLPVWLTEFSCGDGADGKPTSDQLAFMRAIFPLLDAAPHVERYAWMSARDGKGLRGLVADGKLTAVGELFNSV